MSRSPITGRRLNLGKAFRTVTANSGTTMSSRGNGFMRVLPLPLGGAIALPAAPWNACIGGGMRQSGGGFLNPNKEDGMQAFHESHEGRSCLRPFTLVLCPMGTRWWSRAFADEFWGNIARIPTLGRCVEPPRGHEPRI